MAYCEDVAYSSLHYDIPMVERIKAMHVMIPKMLLGTFYELADFKKWNKSKNLGKTAKAA